MGADRRPNDRRRAKAVPLASLPVAQRRLITALIEAAKVADTADTKMAESELRRETDIYSMARSARVEEGAAELHARAGKPRQSRARLP